MDYNNNARFFDKEFNRKNGTAIAIGSAASGIGGVLVALSLFGRGFTNYIFHSLGWPFLIFGVVVLCIAFSKRVKESEVTGVGDELIREVKETCNERLDFPDDFEERSLIFVGCPINDGNIENARKLKSGNYLTPEFIISLFYEKKNELYIMQRTVSLIKEGYSDVEKKLSYSDFDKCLVEIDTLKNGAKINFVRFYKDGAVFFETPLVDNDYYKEEYFNTVMHDKERFERS